MGGNLDSEGYLRRAATIVFGDRTWWWRSIAIGLVGMVPLVGTVAILGYDLTFMRTLAWGRAGVLPRFNEPAKLAARGMEGFAVGCVWVLFAIPLLILLFVANQAAVSAHLWSRTPWWTNLVAGLVLWPLGVAIDLALLRTAVWMKPSAGMSWSGLRGLVRRCPEGFKRVAAISIAVYALNFVATALTNVGPLHTLTQSASAFQYGWSVLVALAMTPLLLVKNAAYGLWGADTQPATWPPLRPITRIMGATMHSTWRVPYARNAYVRPRSYPPEIETPPARAPGVSASAWATARFAALRGWFAVHPARLNATLLAVLAVPWIWYLGAPLARARVGESLPVAVRGAMLGAVLMIALGFALFAWRDSWAGAQDTPLEGMRHNQVGVLGLCICLIADILPALALVGVLT